MLHLVLPGGLRRASPGGLLRSSDTLGRAALEALATGARRRGALTEPLSDERTRDVVVRARAGDEEAFGELFTAHEARVLRICRRMLGNADEARDARSEVFLRARRALGTYDLERPFPPWLFGVAGNHCIDLLRQRAREQRLFADVDPQDAELHVEPAEGERASALSRILAAEETRALDRAIEGLPLRYRLPLLLRYFGDNEYTTIAAVLGVTTGQVGSLLYRAKTLLRRRVAKEHGESR
jgi:RNA polymerase sigma-70 factor (ECF subfamily)